MLFQFLDNLRERPKHVREQYAFAFAMVFTFVVGGIWTLSLPSRFAELSNVAAVASSTNAAPFSNFIHQLKSQFKSAKDEATLIISTSTAANTPSTSLEPLSAASSTEAALEMQISPENMAAVGSNATATSAWNARPVMIGTSTKETQ